MKKVSLIIAVAVCLWSFQSVNAQDKDTNRVEVKKKVKVGVRGHTTTKTKIEGSGSAGKAAVESNGTRPVIVRPTTVVVNPSQPTPPQIVTVPNQLQLQQLLLQRQPR
jgi:hypothetical protein